MYYGINQKVIESIVLDYIESGKLFHKIENELKEYVKDTIMGSVSEDYDTFQEIAEWIENHQGDINNIVELIKDKVSQEQIADMATQTWVNENFLDEHQDLSKYDTIESVDGKIKDVKDDLSIVKNDLDIAEKNIETIQGQVNTINENISDIEKNVSILELNHTTDINKTNEDISSLRSDVEEHKKTCDASILKISTDFSELKSNHNKDISDINTSILTNLVAVNNRIDNVDSKIDSKVDDIKKELQNIQSVYISELTKKIESLQSELTQLKNSNLVKIKI